MIAIAGGKGGCGKTTTTLGLARALAGDGCRPLAVDADRSMPNLHAIADVPREPGLSALVAGRSLSELVQESDSFPGVRLLPRGASGESEGVETAVFDRLQVWSGPVLLDCPAGAAADAAGPLRAATETLLVTSPTPPSLCDTAKTAAMARTLDAPPVGVVLVEPGPALAGEATGFDDDDARRLFDCPLLGTVPASSGRVLADRRVRSVLNSVARNTRERKI
jgi:septum site-determining protein MinD